MFSKKSNPTFYSNFTPRKIEKLFNFLKLINHNLWWTKNFSKKNSLHVRNWQKQLYLILLDFFSSKEKFWRVKFCTFLKFSSEKINLAGRKILKSKDPIEPYSQNLLSAKSSKKMSFRQTKMLFKKFIDFFFFIEPSSLLPLWHLKPIKKNVAKIPHWSFEN